MADRIRAAVVGVGEMGRVLTRQLLDRGVQVVGAYGHRSNIGCDLGEVVGLDRALGVAIERDLAAGLSAVKPDVAFVTVGSELAAMMPLFKTCIEAGVNVVTAAEEPFYAQGSNPGLAAELDALARAGGVTVFAGGIQDVYWYAELMALTGACNKVQRIMGVGGCDVDNYGPGTARVIRVGATEDEYKRSLAHMPLERDYFGLALGAIARGLDDEIASAESEVIPLIARKPVFSRALGREIVPGQVVGQKQVTTARTVGGIELASTFITAVGERERNEWTIEGEPELTLVNPVLPGPEATCAALVNRTMDVLEAPSGYVTVADLSPVRFHKLG